MTWLFVVYLSIGYYYFLLVFKHFTDYDTADTVILNAFIALTIGPVLLVPALVVNWAVRGWKYINEH